MTSKKLSEIYSSNPADAFDGTEIFEVTQGGVTKGGTVQQVADFLGASLSPTECIYIACSDETTALSSGAGKVTFRIPYAFTLTDVRASLTTAQTSGSSLTVDVKKNGTSLFSIKPAFDNGEKSTLTGAGYLFVGSASTASLADDDEITIDITQLGDGTAKGLKVMLIGHRT